MTDDAIRQSLAAIARSDANPGWRSAQGSGQKADTVAPHKRHERDRDAPLARPPFPPSSARALHRGCADAAARNGNETASRPQYPRASSERSPQPGPSVGLSCGKAYLVLEMLTGGDLAELLDRRCVLNPPPGAPSGSGRLGAHGIPPSQHLNSTITVFLKSAPNRPCTAPFPRFIGGSFRLRRRGRSSTGCVPKPPAAALSFRALLCPMSSRGGVSWQLCRRLTFTHVHIIRHPCPGAGRPRIHAQKGVCPSRPQGATRRRRTEKTLLPLSAHFARLPSSRPLWMARAQPRS